MTMLTTALWLSVSCWVLAGTRAHDCGPNVVTMVTVRNPWICRLRFDTEKIPLKSCRTRRTISDGRAVGMARYWQEIARERRIVRSGVRVLPGTPENQHYNILKPIPGTIEFFKRNLRMQVLAKAIGAAVAHEYGVPRQFAGDILLHLNLSADPALCTPTPEGCDASALYRSSDGSCNNLKHPTWGMTTTPFTRLLLPVYDDGVYSPRKARDGSNLPSGRLLRTHLMPDYDVPASYNTLIVMQWGQLFTHDVAGSPDRTGIDGMGIMCCTDDGQHLDPSLLSNGCIPIDVPADDYYYRRYGKRCMSMQRNNVTFALNCHISASENLNIPTHFVDASVVYGSSLGAANSLREFRGGRLLVSVDHNRDMLPPLQDPSRSCDVPSNESCFRAGDGRVNQNPQLAVLQLVMLREHNRVARRLRRLNPSWSDEKLYQEARRIVVAQFQHITYNELVPIYLGHKYARKYRLLPLESGYNNCYDPELKPNTLSSFAGAAFRAFHSLAQGELELVPESRCPVSSVNLSDWFTRPDVMQRPRENYDLLLRGLVTQPSQWADVFTTNDLTDRSLRRSQPFGQDLNAMDIVRARDQGIGNYNDFRELCKLPRASSFEDFSSEIPEKTVKKMAALYKHPDDVDLFVGGLMETPAYGSLLGHTFHTIVSEQFHRYKCGDRFWYENGGFAHSFSPAQLTQIRKTSLSRLLCDNGDNIKEMQPDGFRQIAPKNPLLSCDSPDIPRMDLRPWKE